jgi:hypothetical protein
LQRLEEVVRLSHHRFIRRTELDRKLVEELAKVDPVELTSQRPSDKGAQPAGAGPSPHLPQQVGIDGGRQLLGSHARIIQLSDRHADDRSLAAEHCQHCRIAALDADDALIDGTLDLRGSAIDGDLTLLGADIRSDLAVSDEAIVSGTLTANRLTVAGDVFLHDGSWFTEATVSCSARGGAGATATPRHTAHVSMPPVSCPPWSSSVGRRVRGCRGRRARRSARRSSAVLPPQIPSDCPVSKAHAKQWVITGQPAHTALARSVWSTAGPVEPTGNHNSGSRSRHAALSRQSMLILSFSFMCHVALSGQGTAQPQRLDETGEVGIV